MSRVDESVFGKKFFDAYARCSKEKKRNTKLNRDKFLPEKNLIVRKPEKQKEKWHSGMKHHE